MRRTLRRLQETLREAARRRLRARWTGGPSLTLVAIAAIVLEGWFTDALGQSSVAAARAAAEQVALAVQRRNADALLQLPGVHGVGVGLMADGAAVGLHVFVDRRAAAGALPAVVEGVPVHEVRTAGFVAHDGGCSASAPCHAGVYSKPVPMGVSTSDVLASDAGTLGFRVHRTGDPTLVGYVTNNHVAAATAGGCAAQLRPAALVPFNVQQCQPGLFDSIDGTCPSARRIGALLQVVPIIMGTQYPNTVDAAFVQSRRGCVSRRILDVGVPAAQAADPQLGDVVILVGRSSGRQTNKVSTVHVTLDVGYASACGTARFVGQVVTEPVDTDAASRPGDSGAPVVKQIGTVPTGLNFAGDGVLSVMTPLPVVLRALDVEIDTAADSAASSACQ